MARVLKFPAPEKCGYVRVCSDAFTDSGILYGDLAVLDLTQQPPDGELAVVFILAAAFIGYIYREGQNIRLTAHNSCYTDEVIPAGKVKLIARVLCTRHKTIT